MPLSECAGYRAKKASVHRSSTSNKVTGRQSLSSSTKLIPGNIATRAASTKVPAQMECTWCSPVAAEIGKRNSSVFSLWGPMSLRRLCHHPASVARRDLVACGLPTHGCPPWHRQSESPPDIHTAARYIQRSTPSGDDRSPRWPHTLKVLNLRIWHQSPLRQTLHWYRNFLSYESHLEGQFVVGYKTAENPHS